MQPTNGSPCSHNDTASTLTAVFAFKSEKSTKQFKSPLENVNKDNFTSAGINKHAVIYTILYSTLANFFLIWLISTWKVQLRRKFKRLVDFYMFIYLVYVKLL